MTLEANGREYKAMLLPHDRDDEALKSLQEWAAEDKKKGVWGYEL